MVVAAVVAAGTALVHGQVRGTDPIELVTLRSGSYTDFRQVFVREAPAGVSVPATLRDGRPWTVDSDSVIVSATPDLHQESLDLARAASKLPR